MTFLDGFLCRNWNHLIIQKNQILVIGRKRRTEKTCVFFSLPGTIIFHLENFN